MLHGGNDHDATEYTYTYFLSICLLFFLVDASENGSESRNTESTTENARLARNQVSSIAVIGSLGSRPNHREKKI